MPELEHLTLTYPRAADSREAGIVELTACSARIRMCELPGALKAGLREGLVVSLQRPTAHAAPKSLSVTIREAFDWDPRNYSQQPGAFTHIHLPSCRRPSRPHPVPAQERPYAHASRKGDDVFDEPKLARALVHCTNLRYLHFRRVRFADNPQLFKELYLPCPSRLVVGRTVFGDHVPRVCCLDLVCLWVTGCRLPFIDVADESGIKTRTL